jgi:DNA primase
MDKRKILEKPVGLMTPAYRANVDNERAEMITTKPDIITVLENEGIELRKKGRYFWALCPFHSERHPSFKVDPERQSFFCFGCGVSGDVVDFVRKYKGLSFKEALEYLNIGSGLYRLTPREIRKRELIKTFRQWCKDYHDDLCRLVRTLYKAKQKVKDEADLERLIPFYHQETSWLYQIEILQSDDIEAKLKLYKEVRYGN